MRSYRILNLSLFILGLLLLINSRVNITAAAIGISSISSTFSSIVGIILIGCSLILFAATSGLEEKVQKESNLTKLINTRVPPTGRVKCTILIDADFLDYLQKNSLGEKLPDNFFGEYNHKITSNVESELKRPSGETRQPLVPIKLINNLKRLKTNILKDYHPKEDSKEVIFKYWKEYTPQGKAAHDEWKEDKFKKSGDLQMLCYALERNKEYTIILTNNYSEIGKIAERLRKNNMVNIFVIKPEEIFDQQKKQKKDYNNVLTRYR